MRRLRNLRLAWLLAVLAVLQSVQIGTSAPHDGNQGLESRSTHRSAGNAPLDPPGQGSTLSRQSPDDAFEGLPSHGPSRLELLRCRGQGSKAPSKLCTHLVEDMGFNCDDVTVRGNRSEADANLVQGSFLAGSAADVKCTLHIMPCILVLALYFVPGHGYEPWLWNPPLGL